VRLPTTFFPQMSVTSFYNMGLNWIRQGFERINFAGWRSTLRRKTKINDNTTVVFHPALVAALSKRTAA